MQLGSKRWLAVIIRITELRKYPTKRAKAVQRIQPRRDLRLTLQQKQSAAIIDNPVTMPQFTNISPRVSSIRLNTFV